MLDSLPSTLHRRVRALRHDPTSINDEQSAVEISLVIDRRPIGKGTFAAVYKCHIESTEETLAMKEVLIDRAHKNRELEILRELNHPNIVQLKYHFVREERQKKMEFSCLLMELLPETVYSLLKRCFSNGNDLWSLDIRQIKFYTFQLFRALAYLHTRGIAHRDIKPSNLLVDSQTNLLKLCDFGAAKRLLPDDTSVSYICSRYYRAPELILGATSYTTSIDIWAAACVVTEFYSGVPLFKGRHALVPIRGMISLLLGTDQNDQLLRIILLLGEPNVEERRQMQPKSSAMIDEQLQRRAALMSESRPLVEHLALISQSDRHCVELCRRMLEYSPARRLTALEVLTDCYYQEIRDDALLRTRLTLNPIEHDLFHSLSSPNKCSSTDVSNETPNQ